MTNEIPDNLKPMKGILAGVVLGALLWGVILSVLLVWIWAGKL